MNQIRLLAHRDGIATLDEMDERLASATSEADFGNLGFDLATSFAVQVESLINLSWPRGERNDGILRGLAVRTVKLLDRLADEISLGHGDLEPIYQRLLDDTQITLGYLLAKGSVAFDAFVAESVTAQKRRKTAIEARIEGRGGEPEPIEVRQLQAIADEIALAGLDPNAPRSERLPPMDQRFAAVFPEGDLLYDFGYRLGSDSVHGGWKDLISHHVDPHDGFSPRLEWWPADPNPLFAAMFIGSEIMRRYTEAIGAGEGLIQSFADTRDFSGRAVSAYGTYYDSARRR